MSGKKSVFDNPVLSTKVKSANVKILPEALIGYLVGPFCGLLANSLFGAYLVTYFQDVLFADVYEAGNYVDTFLTIFPMVSAVLIVIGNLLAGQLIERTKTKAGKARPYILLSSVVLAVASVLMFINIEALGTIGKMVWLVIAYNLFYAVAFPLYNTANSALVPVSTRNGKQRSWLASLVNMATLGGAGASSIVFPMIIGMLTDSTGYFILFLIIGIVTFVGCIAQYYFTRERVTEESIVHGLPSEESAASVKGPSMGKQAKALFTDKFFIIAIVFYLLYQFAGAIKNASMESYTYMWATITGVEDTATAASGFMSVLGIVGAVPMAVAILFVSPLCNKFGKRPVVFAGMAIGVIGGIIAGIWYQNAIVVGVGVALKCLGSAPAGYMILAMIADCLDHIEAKHGFRCDGLGMSLYSSVLIASVPIATGIVSGLRGVELFGVANYGSVIAYIWIETGVYIVAGIIVLFFGVEKYIPEDRQIVLDRQRAEAEVAGIEWIPPEERLRLEEEESDRLAEEARIAELKARCEKKGLDFEAEERAYRAKLEAKQKKKNKNK